MLLELRLFIYFNNWFFLMFNKHVFNTCYLPGIECPPKESTVNKILFYQRMDLPTVPESPRVNMFTSCSTTCFTYLNAVSGQNQSMFWRKFLRLSLCILKCDIFTAGSVMVGAHTIFSTMTVCWDPCSRIIPLTTTRWHFPLESVIYSNPPLCGC